METREALSQIRTIRDQMARGQVYKGYRSVPVAFVGLLALGLAAFQAFFQPTLLAETQLVEWGCLALLVIAALGGWLTWQAVISWEGFEQRLALKVLLQFLPALAAGALVGVLGIRGIAIPIAALPGFFALCFGLGVIAMGPYLPKASFLVGLWYLAAAALLLFLAPTNVTLSPWAMGITFGCGNLFGGLVLFFTFERGQVKRK